MESQKVPWFQSPPTSFHSQGTSKEFESFLSLDRIVSSPRGDLWTYHPKQTTELPHVPVIQIQGKGNLVGGWLIILKNDGVRQWEGWHPIYKMENKIHIWNHQAATMEPVHFFFFRVYGIVFHLPGAKKMGCPRSPNDHNQRGRMTFGNKWYHVHDHVLFFTQICTWGSNSPTIYLSIYLAS